ncbi:hypothetical protein DFH06DRAFT_1195738 [Mycena polygramma]|nr:hypothetical protein DFH06DRAFT_1195738 [Mycena polygramma]
MRAMFTVIVISPLCSPSHHLRACSIPATPNTHATAGPDATKPQHSISLPRSSLGPLERGPHAVSRRRPLASRPCCGSRYHQCSHTEGPPEPLVYVRTPSLADLPPVAHATRRSPPTATPPRAPPSASSRIHTTAERNDPTLHAAASTAPHLCACCSASARLLPTAAIAPAFTPCSRSSASIRSERRLPHVFCLYLVLLAYFFRCSLPGNLLPIPPPLSPPLLGSSPRIGAMVCVRPVSRSNGVVCAQFSVTCDMLQHLSLRLHDPRRLPCSRPATSISLVYSGLSPTAMDPLNYCPCKP